MELIIVKILVAPRDCDLLFLYWLWMCTVNIQYVCTNNASQKHLTQEDAIMLFPFCCCYFSCSVWPHYFTLKNPAWQWLKITLDHNNTLDLNNAIKCYLGRTYVCFKMLDNTKSLHFKETKWAELHTQYSKNGFGVVTYTLHDEGKPFTHYDLQFLNKRKINIFLMNEKYRLQNNHQARVSPFSHRWHSTQCQEL